MHIRLLMLATALLYIGPLMAGLGGFGWGLVPAFVGLFMIWLFVLRPQQWPRNRHEWAQPEAWSILFTNGVVQLFLVTILFGVGRGVGGVLGRLPHFGAELPLLISFLSIPLSRMVWNPWKAAELDGFLDDALQQINRLPDDQDDARLRIAQRFIAPLRDLPDDTSADEVGKHLVAMAAHTDPESLRHALLERAHHHDVGRAEVIAMILHCTDPRLIEIVFGDGPTYALPLLPHDPELITLYARRLSAALDQDAEIWGKCPNVDSLQALVAKYDNTPAEAPLRDLIEATNAAAPEDGLA